MSLWSVLVVHTYTYSSRLSNMTEKKDLTWIAREMTPTIKTHDNGQRIQTWAIPDLGLLSKG